MAAWHEIPEAQNLKAGEMAHGRAGGEDVLVVNNAGEFRSFINRCGHMNAPLDLGTFKSGVLKCPQHNAVFKRPDGRGPRSAVNVDPGDGQAPSGAPRTDGGDGAHLCPNGVPSPYAAPGRTCGREGPRVRLNDVRRPYAPD